jgi:hypothetical protein
MIVKTLGVLFVIGLCAGSLFTDWVVSLAMVFFALVIAVVTEV